MSEHHHHHGHSHSNDTAGGFPSDTEGVLKLLAHWIHHNDDPARHDTEWVPKVDALECPAAAERMRAAAELTHAVSREFEAAARAIRDQADSGCALWSAPVLLACDRSRCEDVVIEQLLADSGRCNGLVMVNVQQNPGKTSPGQHGKEGLLPPLG